MAAAFPLLRNRAVGPLAITVCPLALAKWPPLPLARDVLREFTGARDLGDAEDGSER